MSDSQTQVRLQKIQDRRQSVNDILTGKTSMRDFSSEDIKKLTVLMARMLTKDGCDDSAGLTDVSADRVNELLPRIEALDATKRNKLLFLAAAAFIRENPGVVSQFGITIQE